MAESSKTAEDQYKERLDQGNSAWKAAPVGGFKLCPIGHHTAVLEEAKVVESKQKHELFFAIKYVVRIGEHKGEKADEMFSLDDETRFGWLKSRIEDLGYTVPDTKGEIEELGAELTRSKPVVVFDVSHYTKPETGKKYININNMMLITDADLAAEVASEPENEPEESGEAEEPAAEEAADDAEVVEVGDMVTFKDGDGDEYEAEVTAIDEDGEAKVKDSEGNPWDVPVAELTPVMEDAADEGEGEADEASEQKKQLCTIADAHDCEVDEDNDVDTIVAAMKKKTWKAKELGEDEIAVLKEAGIPIAKAVAKKAAKKTAKKAAKKTAKKAKTKKKRALKG